MITSQTIASTSEIHAWFNVEKHNNMVQIQPTAQSPELTTIRYFLTANKKGASGTSQNRQQGTVTLHPGKITPLGKISLNIQDGDQLHLSLDLYKEHELVYSDEIILP